MASTLSVDSDRRSVHIPKLKYRQSTYDVHSAETASIALSQPTIPTISTSYSSGQSDFCPSPQYPPSPSETSTNANSRRPSLAPSSLAPPQTPDRKKRKGFFASLFATKEPSAQALADYEKHLKTQGTLKNGRITAVGMPGVSSAKLPPTVPKVNSKWDGTPLTTKELDKKERVGVGSQDRFTLLSQGLSSSDQSLSSSSTSLRTSARRPTSKGTIGGRSMYTSHSDGNRNQLADLYGWEIADYSGGAEGNLSRPSTQPTSIRSMPTYTSNGVAIEPTEPPKIPKAFIDPAPAAGTLSPNLPAHSHSPSLTPRDELPMTPNEPSPLAIHGSDDSRKTLQGEQEMAQDHIRTTVVEAPTRADEVIIKSSGVNILSPPATAKRKSKLPPKGPENEEQANNALKEPKSILKKGSTPSLHTFSQQRPALDPLYTQTTALESPKGAQWRTKMPFGFHQSSKSLDDTQTQGQGLENTKERTVTPTPESGSLLQRRKSRIGIFKK